jgi:hypothetical protein
MTVSIEENFNWKLINLFEKGKPISDKMLEIVFIPKASKE